MAENNWVVSPLKNVLADFVSETVRGNNVASLLLEVRAGARRVDKVKHGIGKLVAGIAAVNTAEYILQTQQTFSDEPFKVLAEIGTLLASMEQELDGAVAIIETAAESLEDYA